MSHGRLVHQFAATFEFLKRHVELGITMVDHAHVYSGKMGRIQSALSALTIRLSQE